MKKNTYLFPRFSCCCLNLPRQIAWILELDDFGVNRARSLNRSCQKFRPQYQSSLWSSMCLWWLCFRRMQSLKVARMYWCWNPMSLPPCFLPGVGLLWVASKLRMLRKWGWIFCCRLATSERLHLRSLGQLSLINGLDEVECEAPGATFENCDCLFVFVLLVHLTTRVLSGWCLVRWRNFCRLDSTLN
jgi:hypothetical protein